MCDKSATVSCSGVPPGTVGGIVGGIVVFFVLLGAVAIFFINKSQGKRLLPEPINPKTSQGGFTPPNPRQYPDGPEEGGRVSYL